MDKLIFILYAIADKIFKTFWWFKDNLRFGLREFVFYLQLRDRDPARSTICVTETATIDSHSQQKGRMNQI